jgi:hypothetical protein
MVSGGTHNNIRLDLSPTPLDFGSDIELPTRGLFGAK